MKSTKYVEPFIKEVEYWEKSLGYVAECIEVSRTIYTNIYYCKNGVYSQSRFINYNVCVDFSASAKAISLP